MAKRHGIFSFLLLCGILFTSVYSQECTPWSGNRTYSRDLQLSSTSRITFNNSGLVNVSSAFDCYWRVSAPNGTFVMLTFTRMDIYTSWGCETDYVELREGTNNQGHLYGRFCSFRLTNIIYSNGQDLFIKFHSDPNHARLNKLFDITLTGEMRVSSCTSFSMAANQNIHLTKSPGVFTSPWYDGVIPYPADWRCAWRIIAPEGYIIKVRILHMDIEGDGSLCNYDSLSFYDGMFDSDAKLGRVCGTSLPADTYSSSTNLMAKFTSDSTTNRKGFKAEFRFLRTESTGQCSAQKPSLQLSGMGGTFFTPNYPLPYPKWIECTWQITVPPGYGVRLSISHFSIKHDYANCLVGYLELAAGGNATSGNSSLGKFCNSPYPKMIYIKGQVLWVHFASKEMLFDNTNTGVRASYEAVTTGPTGVCTPLSNASTNDNLQLADYSGSIHSPNYPAHYPKNMQCTWTITAPPGKRVEFDINDVSIGSSSSCSGGSYLQVRDGNSAESEKKGEYCSGYKNGIYSSGRYMWLRFHSNALQTDTGFSATYKVKDLCDSSNTFAANNDIRFTSYSGNFSSPGYPGFYPTDIQCTWKITVPSGKRVRLLFSHFAIEYSYDCHNGDYIDIRDGVDENSRQIDQLCGYTNPGSVYSSGNHMWVRLRSDYSTTGSRFLATFEAVDKVNVAAIAGGVVAGLVVFIAFIVVAMYCYKRKRPQRASHNPVPQPQPSPQPLPASHVYTPYTVAVVDEPPAPIMHGGYAPYPTGYQNPAFQQQQQPSPYQQRAAPYAAAPYPGYQTGAYAGPPPAYAQAPTKGKVPPAPHPTAGAQQATASPAPGLQHPADQAAAPLVPSDATAAASSAKAPSTSSTSRAPLLRNEETHP